jgi:membrane associated rhomboid family serine protease
VPEIGASGAIAGVLGAYIVLFPRARVLALLPLLFFFPIVYVPAWLMIGLWFLLQLASGTLSLGAPASGGVAYFAHIGGFLAGVVLVPLFARRRRRAPPLVF